MSCEKNSRIEFSSIKGGCKYQFYYDVVVIEILSHFGKLFFSILYDEKNYFVDKWLH